MKEETWEEEFDEEFYLSDKPIGGGLSYGVIELASEKWKIQHKDFEPIKSFISLQIKAAERRGYIEGYKKVVSKIPNDNFVMEQNSLEELKSTLLKSLEEKI